MPIVFFVPDGVTRTIVPLSRCETSTFLVGRNAIPHGTERLVARVLLTLALAAGTGLAMASDTGAALMAVGVVRATASREVNPTVATLRMDRVD